MLRAFGISARVLPGISSVQLLSAAIGRPWQDWKLVSAHGCACDPAAECLTAEGRLLLCLGNEHGLDLKTILRRYPGEPAHLRDALLGAIARKPWGHDFRLNDQVQVIRFMNMTGG